MTERQDVAAAPAPWTGTGAQLPPAPDQSAGGAATSPQSPAEAGRTETQGGAAAAVSGGGVGRPASPGGTGAVGRSGAGPAGTPSRAGRTVPLPDEPGDEPHARVDARKLEAALLGLRKPLVSVPLALEVTGAADARAERLKLLGQIDDYLLPRLRQSGAPILVALVGSTGAGKSTLMNSLVGRQVSATGIRRPTTNSPVLACHPNDMRWFAENVFLPTLPRVRQQGLAMPGRDGLLVLAASEAMPEGVAVLDTPDIDSVVQAHRDFANQFLDASDLWLFVTTARRYADAAVWEMLKDARDRGAALAIALSRVPPAAIQQLSAHFDAMLDANGLHDVRRFIIPETVVTDAQLPAGVAAPVQEYLTDTARRDDRRVAVLTQTMSGVLDTFNARVPALADKAAAQVTAKRELRSLVDAAYAGGLGDFDDATRNGALLCGEVLARWQDFAGTGDLLRALQSRKGRGAGRAKKDRTPARATALRQALQASLESLIGSTADRAAEQAAGAWQREPAGAGLLAGLAGLAGGPSSEAESEPDFVASALADLGLTDGSAAGAPASAAELARASADLTSQAERVVDGWLAQVQRLVREENVTKRSIARVVTFDDQSLALVLAIGVLGYGAQETPDADSANAAPQRVLTSLFGAGLLRDIGVRARQDLHGRVRDLFDGEVRRFVALIDSAGVFDETAATELLQAGFTLESAR
jgi:energy-coupling factor transporter ATP-binding protein EcfA2